MGRLKTIARRTFLVGSAAVLGGVAFGTYLALKPIRNPLLDDLNAGEAALTPHVKITADGITLITPRADKGQGAYSIQAHLIAEELDIDPATATLDPGPPGQAYFNGAILSESVPFAAYDDSGLAQAARDFTAVPAKILQIQITGGSSTVPDMYERLRVAGAVARETLKEAASQRTGIPRAELTTQDGHVVLPGDSRIAYTDLAADAAGLDPITDVTLRDPDQWVRLGKPGLQRTDIIAKSTGTETYGIDIRKDNMLYASVRTHPAHGGTLTGFDATSAEALPGVEKIVGITGGVAAIATNTWYAFQALDAISYEWAPAPQPTDMDAVWTTLATTADDPSTRDHRQRNDGDVDTALSGPDIITATYRVPYLAHGPLEPMNATVLATDDRLDIWTGTQIPLFIRDRAAKIAGLPKTAVHVHVLPMGGSFGHRLEMTHVAQAVEVALAIKGTPVKTTLSREEDMTHEYPRPAALARARGRVSDGKVDTLDLTVAQSALMPNWFGRLTGLPIPGPDATITTGSWDQPFAIPNYRVTGHRAPDMLPVSSWRAVGASGNGFFHDGFLDELMHAAGADPLTERIRLCHHDTSRKVLEAIGALSDWTGPSLGANRGRGVAFCLSFGVPTAIVIDVTNTPSGVRIDHAYIAADVGRALDPTNIEAQLTGGLLFGLSHAIHAELTLEDGAIEQANYDSYPALRIDRIPPIAVQILENGNEIKGIGEPGVPPAAPALANAIFAATGQRLREMPFANHIDFA